MRPSEKTAMLTPGTLWNRIRSSSVHVGSPAKSAAGRSPRSTRWISGGGAVAAPSAARTKGTRRESREAGSRGTGRGKSFIEKSGVYNGEMSKAVLAVALFAMLPALLRAQAPSKAQATPPSELTVDDAFDPAVSDPAFSTGKGPAVLVDERHRNVVTLATYLRPVGRFLEKDGYVVKPSKEVFT